MAEMKLKKSVLVVWLVLCVLLIVFLAEAFYYGYDYDTDEDLCIADFGSYAWNDELKCCDYRDIGVIKTKTTGALDERGIDFLCDYGSGGNIWKHANSFKFKIQTIEGHDYVSNSKKWFKCDEENLWQGIGSEVETLLQQQAAHFLCTKRGEEYWFRECCDDSSIVEGGKCIKTGSTLSNSDRVVLPGLSLYQALDYLSITTTYQTEIRPGSSYNDNPNNYKFLMNNWEGMEALELFFKVEKNDNFFLRIYSRNNLIFEDKLVDYVVDGAVFGEEMHAIIPVEEWGEVERFEIFFNSTDPVSSGSKLEIFKAYLKPKEAEAQKYCSAAVYNPGVIESVWIDDLDDNRRGFAYTTSTTSGPLAGEKACRGLGYVWTGNQCCGDDTGETLEETYEDGKGGCWKSEALENNSAVMEVAYDLSYTSTKQDYFYPQKINFTLSWTGGNKVAVRYNVSDYKVPHFFWGTYDKEFPCPPGFESNCGNYELTGDQTVSCGEYHDCCIDGEEYYSLDLWDLQNLQDIDATFLTMTCTNFSVHQKSFVKTFDFSEDAKEILLSDLIEPEEWAPNSDIVLINVKAELLTEPLQEENPAINFVENQKLWPISKVYFDSKKGTENELVTNDVHDKIIFEFKTNHNTNILSWQERLVAYADWLHVQTYREGAYDVALPCPAGYYTFPHPGSCYTQETQNVTHCERVENLPSTGPEAYCIGSDCTTYNNYLGIGWDWMGGRHLNLDLYIRMKCRKDVQLTEDFMPDAITLQKNFSQICVSNVCDLALAGKPPYEIENIHPEIYDLYFVDKNGNETLINQKKSFDIPGHLRAQKLPLQVLFFNGSLWGCNISNFMSRNFIDSAGICEVKGEAFCAGSSGWGFGSSGGFSASQRNNLKQALSGPNASASNYLPESCCPRSACWNGTTCVADMSVGLPRPQYNYSCINGSWELTPPILTWDKARSGFCPWPGDCLVEPEGNGSLNYNPLSWYTARDYENQPICIADQQFIADNFCENNIWESRTKKIAIQLLNLVNNTGDVNSYTLYCDDYNNAFYGSDLSSIIEYIIGPRGGPFNQPQPFYIETNTNAVNHFCVLDYTKTSGAATGQRRVIATSNNIPIDDSQSSFLYALGQTDPTYCNSAIGGQNIFDACGPNNNDDSLWYSDDLNSVVVGSATIEMNGLGFFQSIIDWFRNPINNIINWIVGYTPPLGQVQKDYSFVSNTTQMKYFYSAARSSGKKVTAVMEEINQTRIILAKYENFTIDMCAFVLSAAQGKGITLNVTLQGAICNQTGNDFNVLVDDSIVPGLWRELTAGLTIT